MSFKLILEIWKAQDSGQSRQTLTFQERAHVPLSKNTAHEGAGCWFSPSFGAQACVQRFTLTPTAIDPSGRITTGSLLSLGSRSLNGDDRLSIGDNRRKTLAGRLSQFTSEIVNVACWVRRAAILVSWRERNNALGRVLVLGLVEFSTWGDFKGQLMGV